jgi:poly[(R)-3-hydroxyalkanoate] polymerase subunit PhaC
VLRTPLLIVPPWINKFYILDLRPEKSYIKWCVDQGITVFVISWVNPDKELGKKTFDDYMKEGPLTAMDVIEKLTGEMKVHTAGYCVGGTLLACTLAWLAEKRRQRVTSATFFAAQVDFTHAGDLLVFVDEDQISTLEKEMETTGVLEGSKMAMAFNMLRSNDLIWSFVINNYLMGRDPFPFDLLHWNQDATRMPATMHSFYLRNMYMKNLLREPGGITLSGVPIDVSKVTVPTYFASAIEDHIAPWKATYAGAQLLGGKSRFVLSGSGHIAGMINPPAANKYGFWLHEKLPPSADAWLAGAKQHEGSWWTDWAKWLGAHRGKEAPARIPGKGRLKVIEAAPGSYARIRADGR